MQKLKIKRTISTDPLKRQQISFSLYYRLVLRGVWTLGENRHRNVDGAQVLRRGQSVRGERQLEAGGRGGDTAVVGEAAPFARDDR